MIPKAETTAVTYCDKNCTVVAIMTKKKNEDTYTLYEIGGEAKRLGRGNNPLELEAKYNMDKRMGMSHE